jgi:hypothetical protein
MIRWTLFIRLFVWAVIWCPSFQGDTNSNRSILFVNENCVKNGPQDADLLEECVKILREEEKGFYNALSEYFLERSSYHVLLEELRKDVPSDENASTGQERNETGVLISRGKKATQSGTSFDGPPSNEWETANDFTYSPGTRQRAENEKYNFNLRGLLCTLNGGYVMDWSKFHEYDWLYKWRAMVNSETEDVLFLFFFLPQQGNEILSWMRLRRVGEDLLITAGYSIGELGRNPSRSVSVDFHLKFIVNYKEGVQATFIREYQQKKFGKAPEQILRIRSLKWNLFDTNTLPILIFQLIHLEK